MARRVILVTGPPCAGKTTYVAQHAQPGDIVIDRDTIDAPPNRAEAIVRRRLAAVAHMTGRTAWVIRSVPEADARHRLAEQLRADEVLVLRPPMPELMSRASRRPNPRATYAAIRRWDRLYGPAPCDTGGDVVRSKHRTGRPYRTARAEMFKRYGRTCHLCGHRGAGEADHLTPISVDSDQPIDSELMRPSHGANYPCPVCPGGSGKGRACNQERGVRPVGAMFTPTFDW